VPPTDLYLPYAQRGSLDAQPARWDTRGSLGWLLPLNGTRVGITREDFLAFCRSIGVSSGVFTYFIDRVAQEKAALEAVLYACPISPYTAGDYHRLFFGRLSRMQA
jgi:hypothetical protein